MTKKAKTLTSIISSSIKIKAKLSVREKIYIFCFSEWKSKKDIYQNFAKKPDLRVLKAELAQAKKNIRASRWEQINNKIIKLREYRKKKTNKLEKELGFGSDYMKTVPGAYIRELKNLISSRYIEPKNKKNRSTLKPFFDTISGWKVYDEYGGGYSARTYTYGELEAGKATEKLPKHHAEKLKADAAVQREKYIAFKKFLKILLDNELYRSVINPLNLDHDILSFLDRMLKGHIKDGDTNAEIAEHATIISGLIASRAGLDDISIRFYKEKGKRRHPELYRS